LLVAAFENQIERGVVVVFGQLAGRWRAVAEVAESSGIGSDIRSD